METSGLLLSIPLIVFTHTNYSLGEDPYLSGQFGTAYTIGLQNGTLDSRYLQAVVTLKHWDAYQLDA